MDQTSKLRILALYYGTDIGSKPREERSQIFNSFSDTDIYNYNANRRGVLKSDPVYQRLLKAQDEIKFFKEKPTIYQVQDIIQEFLIKMEARTMTKEEYEGVLNKSISLATIHRINTRMEEIIESYGHFKFDLDGTPKIPGVVLVGSIR